MANCTVRLYLLVLLFVPLADWMVVAPPSTYLAHTDAFLFYSVETQKQQILPNVCSQQMENVGEKT